MGYMFYDCSGLDSLDLSGWNTANVTNMSNMFNGCSELTTIYAGEDWSTEKVTSSGSMFSDCCNLVGGMGTTYDESHVNKAYAHIDGGLDNPGYFTGKTTAQRGDVNNDGNIDVDDVTTLIAAVLGNTTVDSTVADVNNDNSVDIDDVTALIGRVLNGTWE
jgi:surface protein